MQLDEYLWKNKIKQKDFAPLIGLAPHSLSMIVQKKVSPKLYVAINIISKTEGKVTYAELLREKDLGKLVK